MYQIIKQKQVLWKKYNFTTAYKDGVYSKFNYEASFDGLWLVIEIKDTLENLSYECQVSYDTFIKERVKELPVGDSVILFEYVDEMLLHYVVKYISTVTSGDL